MPRPEKVSAVADIKERLDGAQAVFLAEYAGLSVKEQQTLRRELRANDAEFKVMKMTLARLAADELDLEELDELLSGPTGMAYADGDPSAVAKVLRDFARLHGVFTIKGGLLGREFLTPERIAQLADIPPRDVLLAQIAGTLQAPMARTASLLASLPRNTATVLQQLLDRRTEEAPEPKGTEEPATAESADEEPATEESAAEEPAAAEEPGAAHDTEAEPASADDPDDASATEVPEAAEGAPETTDPDPDNDPDDDPAPAAEEEK